MILIKERDGKLIEYLSKLIYSDVTPVKEYKMLQTDGRYQDVTCLDPTDWKILERGQLWGGHREFYYLNTVVTIPESMAGQTVVYELRTGKEGDWDALNPQFLAYVNGKVKHGLDVNHREILLTDCAVAGEKFDIMLSAFTGDNNFQLFMDSEIKVLHKDVEKYYYDISVPYEVARLLPTDSREYIDIIQNINESLNLLDMRKTGSKLFYDSLVKAQDYITKEFYEKKCSPDTQELICCVGHTHIDCAWLWTLRVTEDKAVRSFSTVLELMRRYPEYKFMSSQPQLYDYVKKNCPEVYEEIKQRVAEGRWEVEGGMWVEADCNITSGESLVRQFIYGKRFFREEFGKDNEILWLPDVFGYSAALPQIMKKCGIKYFQTTKISWNEFNKMPYDTFEWEGIDGTEILTHFCSSRDWGKQSEEGGTETEHFTTYNAMLNPSQVKGNWKRYSQKELHTDSLMSFGYGDGGGGPTKIMLENCRRMAQGIPGCPTTKQSHALEFFKKLEKDVAGNRFLPKWVGELYLEYHRGTYTAMARNKRFNRKSEFAYQNLEFYYKMANAIADHNYPKEELDAAWEVILRNQFHDIVPGSSIREVYEDSKAEYEGILGKHAAAEKETLGAIVSRVAGKKQDVVIFNPNSTSVPAVVRIALDELTLPDDGFYALSDGEYAFPVQKTAEGYVAVVGGIPSKGYKKFEIVPFDGCTEAVEASTKEVDTPYFHVVFNENGQFTSIFDKVNDREVIPEGQLANHIISYENKPHNYDAWDINNYYTEKSWEVNDVAAFEVIEDGPVLAEIRIERPYLDSTIVQYLYFYKALNQIDIRNEVDWNEIQVLLRDYFPVNVHSDEATFEIQYGNVKRPTHSNTMWDFAKFEVCAHKWLDLSEDGFGVSVLNDCKFGCSVKNGVIGLSMLKSSIYPNEVADREHHTFWYSFCPHSGSFREGQTVDKAYMLNNPLKAVVKTEDGGCLDDQYSYVSVDEENAVIEVVKRAEDSDATVIRLYDCYNRRSRIHVHYAGKINEAWESDMLEKEVKQLKVEGDTIIAELKPYEIKTIVIR